MKKSLFIAALVMISAGLFAQKRQAYFGITSEVMMSITDDYPAAPGAGIGAQLSYWLNDRMVVLANTGFTRYFRLGNEIMFTSVKTYDLIPLLAGLELNFSNDIYCQLQAGTVFARKVYEVGAMGKMENEIRNALAYNLSLGVRLTPRSDLLLKSYHSRFNTNKRRSTINNNSLGIGYIYNL